MLSSKFIHILQISLKLPAVSTATAAYNAKTVTSLLPRCSQTPIVRSLLPATCSITSVRHFNIAFINRPSPDDNRHDYKREIHYPEDGKYTIDHLPITRRGGRDPITGRKVQQRWGGGRKTKWRWVDFDRSGPTEPNVYREERVIEIQYDPNRTPFIALVCGGSHLRYIIATSKMKPGDLIRSSSHIPEVPIIGKEGDSYPLGALAVGTKICHISELPGEEAKLMINAGTQGLISKVLPDNKVLVLIQNKKTKRQYALDHRCMCVVGQVSNENHRDEDIGSAQRYRWLGRRPGSGLWRRKDGYCGRKIRAPPPIKSFSAEPVPEKKILRVSHPTEDYRKEVHPCPRRPLRDAKT